MLVLLAGLRERMDFELAAANYDHGLRGEQCDRERELVEDWCRRLEVDFTSGKTVELAKLVRDGANMQNEARRLRYDFLWREADRLGCRRLATGHHSDDQAETVLLRLTQGSSLIGLAGIRPVSDDGRLIRPLLEITRGELEEFAEAEKIQWLEDPTNETDSYRRNRIRHRLIPEIEREYLPGFRTELAALAQDAGKLRRLLDDAVRGLMGKGEIAIAGDTVTADCPALNEYPAVVRRHAFRLAVEQATTGAVILSGRPLAALDRLAVEGSSGGRISLPGELTARREFDKLLLRRSAGPETDSPGDYIELQEGLNRLRLGSACWELDLCIERVEAGEIGRFLPAAGETGAVSLCQAFDLERLNLPLGAGEWYPGDRIEMFGNSGSKKLKKLFVERRVPVSGRGCIPVVLDNEGQIVWVCGVGRSSAAPLDEKTTGVLVVEAFRVAEGKSGDSSGY